ncbi:acyl-CoA dehydrogenase family protein [Nonomuraea terrae]|uniref:acyl-CoA dehydrogenase family protein n=1 Tax=Nonomuraea terrae TaxID=2530383 RepID=UPI0037AF817D
MAEPMFWWSDRQRALMKEAAEFADSHRERSREIGWTSEYPWDVMEEIGRKGWLGATIPDEYGGCADELGGVTSLAILSEELGRVPCATWPFPVTAFGGTKQIVDHANHDQKSRWLPRIARGESFGAVCVTEPFAGSDASGIEMAATRVDGGYVLNGKKRYITDIGAAGHYLVYAVVEGEATPEARAKRRHLSVFYVRGGTPGLTVERFHELGGHEYVRNGILNFHDVFVPTEDRISEEGDGWRILTSGLNLERVLVSAGAVGMMREALYFGASWTSRRLQFGQPVDRFQRVETKLAEAIARVRMDRSFLYHTAALMDRGESCALDASITKLVTSKDGVDICMDMIQAMGGDGVSKYYPVEQLARSMKVKGIGGGSNEVMTGLIYRQATRQMADDLYGDVHGFFPADRREGRASSVAEQSTDTGRVLAALADGYVTDPGLYMRAGELAAAAGLDPAALDAAVGELVRDGKVIAWPSTDDVRMVRATFAGLREAHDPEWYRLRVPDFVGDRDLIEARTAEV